LTYQLTITKARHHPCKWKFFIYHKNR